MNDAGDNPDPKLSSLGLKGAPFWAQGSLNSYSVFMILLIFADRNNEPSERESLPWSFQ